MSSADHPLGLKELTRLIGLHPGQQTALKRVLRELVKEGQLHKEGKRFRLAQKSNQPAVEPSKKHREERTERVAEMNRPRKFEPPLQPPPPPRAGQRGAPYVPKNRSAAPAAVSVPVSDAKRKSGVPLIEGTLKVHPNGFGFVHPSSGDGENIFVTPADAARALDNDRVLIELVRGRDGRSTGRIVEVKDRTRQMVVGTYRETKHGAVVETDIGLISVPRTQLARDGDAVKVRLGVGKSVLEVNDQLTGEVAGSLGKPGDMSVEVLGLAYAQGFHEEFPPQVMDEADRVGTTVSAAEAGEPGRRDVRDLGLVTIDGIDARDFDDAVWVADHARGYRLVVAIADVSHYVREGSSLDAEAFRRATSVYLPGRVLPMLPERLSNGICSLKPDEDRLCMVADMVLDRDGAPVSTELYPAVMRSKARCTYEEVHDVLAGKNVPHREKFRPLFEKLLELSKVLTKMRLMRGAIDFDISETKVELKEDGTPSHMARRERLESHRIVEECMLAANEAVARFFREHEVATVNRYHAPPDEEKLAAFAALAGAHGLNVKAGALSSRELNQVLRQLEGHPEQRALNQLLLRSMMQAVYSSQHEGHYGLGAEDYLHFTSPIRRYPDLIVHRLLRQVWGKRAVDDEKLEKQAVQSSERERAAMKVEREVVAFYACLMVRDRVGEEMNATVSGLSEHGFYAELEGLFIEGMIRPSGWKFDQQLYRGTLGGGKVVKVGLPLKVRLASVNLQARKIDLDILELEGAAVKVRPAEARRPQHEKARGHESHKGRGQEKSRGGERGGEREKRHGRAQQKKSRQGRRKGR